MNKLRLSLALTVTLLLYFSCYSQWSAPINISPGTTAIGTNENAGQCLVKSGDTLRVCYTDRSSSLIKVMYNQSNDEGLTWDTPKVLYSSTGASFTAIANSIKGVHVVWMDSIGTSKGSLYRRSLDGGMTWQPVVILDSVTKFWPGIACSGDLVVASLNKDLAGNTEVFIVRSLDNGATWLPEQQVSNAPNRSEDPAINILGKDVHLSWNDKRSGVMNIYYCHSSDSGATWGSETPLTSVDSYTSMVCLDSNHVDVPHAVRPSGMFDVWLAESADTGTTFVPNQQLTNTPATGEAYPFMVRDGSNLHVVYGGAGANYLYSGDGGLSWDTAVFLSPASQPFIAYTGCALHVIFANAGSLNYMRNPTGNCSATEVPEYALPNETNEVSVFPNPASGEVGVSSHHNKIFGLILANELGATVLVKKVQDNNFEQVSLSLNSLPAGIYFLKVNMAGGSVMRKVVIQQ